MANEHARLKSIVETAVDGIITIDERGTVESFNAAAERIFDYTADEVIGRNVSMLMPAPYHQEHDDYLRRYTSTGEARIIGIGREVTGRRRDATTFPMRLSVGEFWLEGRRLFTGIVHDLTQEKRAEERALQAERLAAVGQMITVLTHESRNLLQLCQANLELLDMEISDRPEAIKIASRIQQAQDRLTHLFGDLREYAAPIHLEREPYHLGRLVGQVLDELTSTYDDRQIQLQEVAHEVDQRCSIDPFRMHQVFRNLLENSIVACRDPVEISVLWSSAVCGDRPALEIAVRDNGPGLSPAQKQVVFEPFFTTKRNGTGLGLAISRRIVEAHGGRIAIGHCGYPGAEFVITLPRQAP